MRTVLATICSVAVIAAGASVALAAKGGKSSNSNRSAVSVQYAKQKCNAGRGNGSELVSGVDCDPGNSGGHNNGGD